MMKLSHFDNVSFLIETRKLLMLNHDLAVEGRGLSIAIQSTYQDDQFVINCRVAIQAELERRIKIIDQQLLTLGVDICE